MGREVAVEEEEEEVVLPVLEFETDGAMKRRIGEDGVLVGAAEAAVLVEREEKM